MFTSFVHIVFFFEFVSCIDMKLKFYATLVFMVLFDFVMWSSCPMNSCPRFAIGVCHEAWWWNIHEPVQVVMYS
jgi:hypothetical protein